MSVHTFTGALRPPSTYAAYADLTASALTAVSQVGDTLTLTFTPDLPAADAVKVQARVQSADTAGETGRVNAADLLVRFDAAITANVAFSALASPTNAQVVAQVQRVTKECTALLRLGRADLLSSTDGA